MDLMFYKKSIAEQVDLSWIKDYVESFPGDRTAKVEDDGTVILYGVSSTKPSSSAHALMQLLDSAGIKYSIENPAD